MGEVAGMLDRIAAHATMRVTAVMEGLLDDDRKTRDASVRVLTQLGYNSALSISSLVESLQDKNTGVLIKDRTHTWAALVRRVPWQSSTEVRHGVKLREVSETLSPP